MVMITCLSIIISVSTIITSSNIIIIVITILEVPCVGASHVGGYVGRCDPLRNP